MDEPTERDVADHQALLAAHRQTLLHYLRQRALLGVARVPPETIHGIRAARDGIAVAKRALCGWGIAVTDHINDTDADEAYRVEVEQFLRAEATRFTRWFFTVFLAVVALFGIIGLRRFLGWSGWSLVFAGMGALVWGASIGWFGAAFFGVNRVIAAYWRGSAWWRKALVILAYGGLVIVTIMLMMIGDLVP